MSTSQAVLDYFSAELANAPFEQVRVLFLDSAGGLLREALISIGSADEVVLPIREIIRHGLEADARGLILVHNHPSGDPRPSAADKAATLKLAGVALGVDMLLHDHLIIGADTWTSFRTLGLL